MFDIRLAEDGTVSMAGRLDAAQAPRAQRFLDALENPYVVDMRDLEYISSAGLGVLLRSHKRLTAAGSGLRLINVSRHIRDIFAYSGFDKLFDVLPPGGSP